MLMVLTRLVGPARERATSTFSETPERASFVTTGTTDKHMGPIDGPAVDEKTKRSRTPSCFACEQIAR
ncbi:hypothetical protein ASL10_01645 [Frigoribacterium sp. Leaf8]|nr:hypothetical protein ASL10_01645 [Frigoribacterium sp. Leaf8]